MHCNEAVCDVGQSNPTKSARSTAWSAMAHECEYYYYCYTSCIQLFIIKTNHIKFGQAKLIIARHGDIKKYPKVELLSSNFHQWQQTVWKIIQLQDNKLTNNIKLFFCLGMVYRQLHLIRAFLSCHLSYCIADALPNLNAEGCFPSLSPRNQRTDCCLFAYKKNDQEFTFAVILWVNRHWYTRVRRIGSISHTATEAIGELGQILQALFCSIFSSAECSAFVHSRYTWCKPSNCSIFMVTFTVAIAL